MAPLSRSMTVRFAGIMLGGLVLFNIVMALALYAPVGRQRAQLYTLPLPGQAAAIIDVLETTPPVHWPRLLDALNSNAMTVRFVAALPPLNEAVNARPIARLLSGYDDAFPNHEIRLELRRFKPIRRWIAGDRITDWVPVRLYVHLHAGPYILIEPARAALFDQFLTRGMLVAGLTGLVIFIGLFFAVRQTAKPVAKLADSARAFAERLDTPDLALDGPRELRELAGAFNDMKGRIRHLVGERTRMLAAIAHDLRTYLTRLRLRAEFITDGEQKNKAVQDLEEMASLIDDTLLLARESQRETTQAPEIALNEEIAAHIAARVELGQKVSLSASLPVEARAAIDPLALRRILANLTDNALRYGGNAQISLVEADASWRIAVEDEGPGIPDQDLERVLAPFERLEASRGRSGGGAGLGLSIVQALAESQGAKLALRNRASGGLCATLVLRALHAADRPIAQ